MPGLQKVAAALVAPGKGILAADTSIATMSRRLEAVGAAPTAAMRRGYRRLLLITQGLAAWISGIILCDETLSQDLPDGTPSGQGAPALGIMADVKVDPGIAFLSGRQSNERACANLAAINAQAAADDTAPWRQTFSFGRALVEDALCTWRGVADNTEDAQRKLADNRQRASQASAAGSPDCAQPLSNERQAGRA